MVRLSDLIEGVGGELSPFEEAARLRLGRRGPHNVRATAWLAKAPRRGQQPIHQRPGDRKQYTGLCLDPADLCVAKLCAGREKDRAFVAALFDGHVVDRDLVLTRLGHMPAEHTQIAAALLREQTPRSH